MGKKGDLSHTESVMEVGSQVGWSHFSEAACLLVQSDLSGVQVLVQTEGIFTDSSLL